MVHDVNIINLDRAFSFLTWLCLHELKCDILAVRLTSRFSNIYQSAGLSVKSFVVSIDYNVVAYNYIWIFVVVSIDNNVISYNYIWIFVVVSIDNNVISYNYI